MLTFCPEVIIDFVEVEDVPTDKLPLEVASTSPYNSDPTLSMTDPLNFLAAFVTDTSSINNRAPRALPPVASKEPPTKTN